MNAFFTDLGKLCAHFDVHRPGAAVDVAVTPDQMRRVELELARGHRELSCDIGGIFFRRRFRLYEKRPLRRQGV